MFDYSCWKATHIVLAKEGLHIDGHLQVIESWRGDCKTGETIIIPQLARFGTKNSRKIVQDYEGQNSNSPFYLSCQRMVLFLRKANTDRNIWEDATAFNNMEISVAWIEEGNVYALVQKFNPGPREILRLDISESEMKSKVIEITQILQLKDLSTRAESILKFVNRDDAIDRCAIFDALADCKEYAIPTLWKILKNDKALNLHGRAIDTLVRVDGINIGDKLTALLEDELKVWFKIGPNLQKNWWAGIGVKYSEVELLRGQYSKTFIILKALQQRKHSGCKKTVSTLYNFWRSLPQLAELDQISKVCDEILKPK